MKPRWVVPVLSLLIASPLPAEDAKKPRAATYHVPYRLTDMQHVLVRAKINGKGPFNFIVDTGAPALFVSKAVCGRLGIEADKNGWGTFERLEIEGGVVLRKVRGRVDDPFQLEGMNGLGLAGVEVHGIIGYNILARYRLEFDFTKDKMGWTPLDFKPPSPEGLGVKGGVGGGLEAVAGIMKVMGLLLGKQAAPEVVVRGFLGIEVADAGAAAEVKGVLAKSPAAEAGLKPGDRISRFQGTPVKTTSDLQRLAAKITPGITVRLTVVRAGESKEITLKAAKGL